MKPCRAVLCIVLAAFAAPLWSADKASDRTYRLQWRDLDSMIRGHRIALTLPSGIKLQGDVTSVQSDELVLDVRKTSNKHAYPKGRAVVPRPEVAALRLFRKNKGHTWRIVGTAIGAGAGIAIAAPFSAYAHNEGMDAGGIIALMVAAPAGLGYLAGWAADRGESVEIVIVPDVTPPSAR